MDTSITYADTVLLLFVSLLLVFKFNNSSPLLFVSRQFVSTTFRLHYYSFPLLFFSTTIRVNYNSIIYSLVDVINNAGKNSYDGSFVSK